MFPHPPTPGSCDRSGLLPNYLTSDATPHRPTLRALGPCPSHLLCPSWEMDGKTSRGQQQPLGQAGGGVWLDQLQGKTHPLLGEGEGQVTGGL